MDEIKRREEEKKNQEDSETDIAPRTETIETAAVIGGGGIAIEPGWGNDRREMTAEDVERIAEIATGVHKQLIYDENVYNIISEEASAYFAGKKSLAEVASLIENRVQTVISESR